MDDLSSLRDEIVDQLRPFGQEHLLQAWDRLSQLERLTLATDIAHVDLAQVARLFGEQHQRENWRELVQRSVPPPAFRLGAKNRFTPEAARDRGEAALRSGKIGAVLVAGGQGSRLGFDHPKGMFRIGPVSHASLFQILFEKLLAIRNRYHVAIPLFVMTSPATHEETAEYLKENRWFGLPREDVILFTQGTMPAVDRRSGKILLEGTYHLSLAPDGHGGVLAAMAEAKAFDKLSAQGIEQLFYFQVDNPLVRVCDPEFLGYHLLSESEMSTLAVAKHAPRDRVGNIVSIDGHLRIIEYSEFNHLDDELIGRRQPDGSLRVWAGNTAIHAFDVKFLHRMAADAKNLPFHVAVKKVPYTDNAGNEIEPTEPNALKFERFIFDLLPAAERAIVVETDQATTFAPLKNPSRDKTDSPETVRAQMIATHTDWLRRSGAMVEPGIPVEISPLFAVDEAELRDKVKPGQRIEHETYFR